MKKLYLFLITAILALCGSAAAQAMGGTISWSIPGAVEVYKWNSSAKVLEAQELNAEGTQFAFSGSMATPFYAYVDEAYTVASFEGVKPNGQIQKATKSSPWGYEGELKGKLYMVSFNGMNEGIDFIITLISEEEANKEGIFTLDIENGADLISEISINSRKLDFKNGKQDITYKPAMEKTLVISVLNGKKLYSVKLNGTALSELDNWGSKYYQIDKLNENDVITIRGYEEDPDIKTCNITIDIPEAAKGAIRQLNNRSTNKVVAPEADGSYVVNAGTMVSLTFNEDYDIKSVTANGAAVTVNGIGTENITINEDTRIVIDAAPIEYKDVTWTIYATSPEGLVLKTKKGMTIGDEITLENGELVNEDIVLKDVRDEDGVVEAGMTIPAGTAYKFTCTVSSKWPGISVDAKNGYWVKTTRDHTLSNYAVSSQNSTVFYIVGQKIERTAKAHIYLQTIGTPATYAKIGLGQFTVDKQGWSEINFDPEYDALGQVRFAENQNGKTTNPAVFVDTYTVSSDDNGLYAVLIKDGMVIKMFADGKDHAMSDITVKTLGKTAAAEFSYDKVKTVTGSFKCTDGTEITITPAEGTRVMIDGKYADETAQPMAANGSHTFTTTAAHTIVLASDDYYELDPTSDSKVESLEKITISFPDSKEVTIAEGMNADEVMLATPSQSAGGTAVSVDKVADAKVPTFVFTFSAATFSQLTTYNFNIPAGFFKIDGVDNTDIDATYTLYKESADINVQFSPTTDIIVGDYHETLNIVFDENIVVAESSDIADKITVSFDGTPLPADDYMYAADQFYFMVMLANNDYLKAGAVTVKLEEGALLLSGTPSPAIEHTWNYVVDNDKKDYSMVFDPEDGAAVTDLSKVTIVFEEATSVAPSDYCRIYLRKEDASGYGYDYTYNPTCTVNVVEGAAKPTVELIFNPAPTASGKYSLEVNWESFILDNKTAFPAQTVTNNYSFTSSTGIDGVIVDGEANDDIYNLQGVKLNAKWSELPAGLYIVGGQKVIKH